MGKSLLPVFYHLQWEIAVVVSSTILLMMDQFQKLKARGFSCAFLGSAQHMKEIEEV